MPVKTISEVIDRLEEIIAWAQANKSRLGYFAALYKRVTLAVKNGIDNGAFDDGARMERLDVIFAGRYLDAFDSYRDNQSLSSCWQKAFDAAENNSLTVFQHLILGINAHINLDLGIAASLTAEGSNIEDLKNDFFKINDVIGSLVNEVQDELSQVSAPMVFIDKICNNSDEAVANFSIDIARREAWCVATTLAEMPGTAGPDFIHVTDTGIAIIAGRIIHPGLWIRFLLWLVKWFEWNDVGKIIEVLNRTISK